jgi:phosphoribosylamine-glycine ligase
VQENESKNHQAGLRVSEEEAKRVADLLRYAVSLNTTVGLVSPERRLAPSTYRAIELAALVLEGKSFEEAVEEAEKSWTGRLEEDHDRALALIRTTRDHLTEAMSGALTPEKAARYLEVENEQFLELVKFPKNRQP